MSLDETVLYLTVGWCVIVFVGSAVGWAIDNRTGTNEDSHANP